MKTNTIVTPYYESVAFNVTTATTDYDVDDQQATFATVFGPTKVVGRYASAVEIRTDNTITVKLNATTNHAITIASTDSPYRIEGVEVRNIFISNASGNTAAVKLLLTDSKY